MEKHIFQNDFINAGRKPFDVYIKRLNEVNGLVAIPDLYWSYCFNYDDGSMEEFQAANDKMISSLFNNSRLQYYADAEEIAYMINQWITT
jgi:hypothetical protein